jgi:hypothetical protein
MEVWKPIPGYLGYEASNLGRIRSVDRTIPTTKGPRRIRGRVLKQFIIWNGYLTTHLGTGNMNKYVHHLVMLAFEGQTPDGLEICHDNDNKLDPALSNLRFDTRVGNMADRKKNANGA